MSAITNAFNRGHKGLVIFLTAGAPSLAGTLDLVKSAYDNGADVIELGIPFSDPLADGPVILESFYRAIKKGTTLKKSIETVHTIRKSCDAPLVFMLSSTLIINHGTKKFMTDTASAGVDGLIIPDVPIEEADEFLPLAKKAGLDTIMLAAPTSTPQRMRAIVKLSSGFVYYINVTGVTGAKKAAPKESAKNIKTLKSMTKLPVLAGFGVTDPQQAKAMSKMSDGVIIGTQAIRVITAAKNQKRAVADLGKFVKSVRKEIDS